MRTEQNLGAHMELKWAVLATGRKESVEQKDYERRVIGGSS